MPPPRTGQCRCCGRSRRRSLAGLEAGLGQRSACSCRETEIESGAGAGPVPRPRRGGRCYLRPCPPPELPRHRRSGAGCGRTGGAALPERRGERGRGGQGRGARWDGAGLDGAALQGSSSLPAALGLPNRVCAGGAGGAAAPAPSPGLQGRKGLGLGSAAAASDGRVAGFLIPSEYAKCC